MKPHLGLNKFPKGQHKPFLSNYNKYYYYKFEHIRVNDLPKGFKSPQSQNIIVIFYKI